MVFSVVRSSQTSEPRSAVRGLGLAKRFRGAAQPPAPPTHAVRAGHTHTHPTTGSRREVWKFGTSSLLCQNGQILRFSRFTNKQSRAHKQRRRSVARRIVWGADWAPVPTAARSSCSSSACCSLQLHLLFGQGVSGAVRVGGGGRQEEERCWLRLVHRVLPRRDNRTKETKTAARRALRIPSSRFQRASFQPRNTSVWKACEIFRA
jgi:hypothetical protein